jgi:hypothetical protein
VIASINLAPGTFLAIVVVSASAGTLAALITSRGLIVPVVVVELLLGVVLVVRPFSSLVVAGVS